MYHLEPELSGESINHFEPELSGESINHFEPELSGESREDRGESAGCRESTRRGGVRWGWVRRGQCHQYVQQVRS